MPRPCAAFRGQVLRQLVEQAEGGGGVRGQQVGVEAGHVAAQAAYADAAAGPGVFGAPVGGAGVGVDDRPLRGGAELPGRHDRRRIRHLSIVVLVGRSVVVWLGRNRSSSRAHTWSSLSAVASSRTAAWP